MALLIWMPHPFFKNCPDTYETPCKLIFFKNNFKHFFLTFVREIMLDFESCLITLVYFLCKAVCRPKVFLYFLPERVSIEPEKMQKKKTKDSRKGDIHKQACPEMTLLIFSGIGKPKY